MWIENQDREEALKEVKIYLISGWDLRKETPTHFLLKRNTASIGGHILVFLISVWWLPLIGNIIYYFSQNQTKKIYKSI